VVVVRGLNSRLFMYRKSDWYKVLKILDEIQTRKETSKVFKRYIELMKNSASESQVSSKGKLTIPYYLREYADISRKNIHFAWVGNRLEIYSH